MDRVIHVADILLDDGPMVNRNFHTYEFVTRVKKFVRISHNYEKYVRIIHTFVKI